MVDIAAQLDAVERAVRTDDVDGTLARVQTLTQTYPSPIDEVWDALTSAERIPRWFLPVSGDLRLGGHYQLEGNAGGTVQSCEPPHEGRAHFGITWEFGGGGETWVTVHLEAVEADRTRVELEHVAPASVVPDEIWQQFGPSGTGIGWDQGLLGLSLHLTDPAARPDDPMAWSLSDEGRAFMRGSADAWAAAQAADGVDLETARAAAAATFAMYTGEHARTDVATRGTHSILRRRRGNSLTQHGLAVRKDSACLLRSPPECSPRSRVDAAELSKSSINTIRATLGISGVVALIIGILITFWPEALRGRAHHDPRDLPDHRGPRVPRHGHLLEGDLGWRESARPHPRHPLHRRRDHRLREPRADDCGAGDLHRRADRRAVDRRGRRRAGATRATRRRRVGRSSSACSASSPESSCSSRRSGRRNCCSSSRASRSSCSASCRSCARSRSAGASPRPDPPRRRRTRPARAICSGRPRFAVPNVSRGIRARSPRRPRRTGCDRPARARRPPTRPRLRTRRRCRAGRHPACGRRSHPDSHARAGSR